MPQWLTVGREYSLNRSAERSRRNENYLSHTTQVTGANDPNDKWKQKRNEVLQCTRSERLLSKGESNTDFTVINSQQFTIMGGKLTELIAIKSVVYQWHRTPPLSSSTEMFHLLQKPWNKKKKKNTRSPSIELYLTLVERLYHSYSVRGIGNSANSDSYC